MALEPLSGLRVIDLFAGTGALGIEALSRGAEHVDFVESDRRARMTLEANLDELEIRARAAVWPLTLPGGLDRMRAAIESASVVLLDPPYGGEVALTTLAVLGELPLRPDVRVVIEHHARDEMPERCGSLQRARERKYGETRVSTYRLSADPDRPNQEENVS